MYYIYPVLSTQNPAPNGVIGKISLISLSNRGKLNIDRRRITVFGTAVSPRNNFVMTV